VVEGLHLRPFGAQPRPPITPKPPARSRAVKMETVMVEFMGKADTSYLDAITAVVRRDTERSYELLELTSVASVLEIGCGPATDTLRARRSERVFQHLPDPAGGPAEMIRVTRPGGRIVVFDTDQTCRMLDTPEQDVWQRLTRYHYERRITSPRAAQQLFRMLREAGLQDITAEPRAMAVFDLAFIRVAGGLDMLKAEAMAAEMVTADEVARLRASMEENAANGTLFGYWTMILAGGTKPAA